MSIFKLLIFLLISVSISSCLKDNKPLGSNDDKELEFPIDCTEREELSGKIVFSSFKTGKGQIYVMNADGTDIKQITHSPTRSSAMPSWSPDGSKIVFLYDSLATIAGTPIYIMDADGSNLRPMYHEEGKRFPIWGSWPKWSPDGKYIVFEHCLSCEPGGGDTEIYLYTFLNDSISRLTYNSNSDTKPSWSKDSKNIMYVSYSDSMQNGDIEPHIYQIDIYGQSKTRLINENIPQHSPSWDSSNKLIAFTTDAKIYLYDLTNNAIWPESFYVDNEYINGPISWSDKGQFLIAKSITSNGREKYLIRIDLCENKIERILDDSKIFSADWISIE